MKKKIIKLILGLTFIFITTFINIYAVNAASGNIYVRSSSSRVVVGNTFKVTVTVSSNAALGSWEYSMDYNSNVVKLTSGTNPVVDYGNGSKTSQSYTYTFKAISSGSARISVKAYNMVAWDESTINVSAGSSTVSIITQAQLEASYSKDNYLKSLSIDGNEITPSFNKETTEYKAILNSNTEKIKVNATVNDSRANLSGTGEYEVSEGDNKIELIVTAENGNKKIYTITATVKDENPIEVTTTDNKKMIIVKREKNLVKPNTYEEIKISMNEEEIPGFYSSITKFTLVGLKDNEGNIDLYIFDQAKNTFTKYVEVEFNKLVIFPTSSNDVPEGYIQTNININGKPVVAYKTEDIDDYALITGLNIETGKTELYQYDSKENTITRYNSNPVDKLKQRIENYMFIILVLGIESIILLFVVMVLLVKRKKSRKYIKQIFEKQNKITEKIDEVKKENKEEDKKVSDTKKLDKI